MNDIDKLKELLFRNEKKALDAITRRLETPESRTADIADVLPESLLRAHADKRLVRAMREPVVQCVKDSIRQEPEDFADALFPVIGPAIRKSIAEALRSMTQSMNQGIENSLSVKTRYQAWRAGVPLAQYILQRNIIYRVEQAFLIKRYDGLLIDHVQHETVASKDSDAVSAMFTAIQDFIRDSFSEDSSESLTTAVMGELTLWAVHGPHAILVCVIRGVPPAGLRSELREILEHVHLRHGEALAGYDGGAPILGVDAELEKCLSLEQQRKAGKKKSAVPLPLVILLVGLLLLAGWLWFKGFTDERRLEKFRGALEATPGIVINDIYREDGQVVVRGMRDPLSAAPTDFAPGLQIDPAELQLELAPYQSLDAAIVERRARRILQPPAGVGFRLEGNSLELSGSAPVEWKQRAQTLAVALPGVDSVDTSRMALSDAELLATARQQLQPPPGVTLAVRNGVLSASGMAGHDWVQQATRQLASMSGLRGGNLLGVAIAERARLSELLATTNGTEIFFSSIDVLQQGQDAVLERLSIRLRQIAALAGQLDSNLQIRVRGYSDGTGNPEANQVVELSRAERVSSWLINAGLPADAIQLQAAGSSSVSSGLEPRLRKAEVTVSVTEGR
ncbi:MAG: OmpA family protein [Gammaproteobacteria bacterium]|nr:OmpA family protein [Gammaproteobacteria bacterium]NNM20674.1 OmpA family protein [Gammaproteobacteria bacterium]